MPGERAYLGDGVYAGVEHGDLVLTTEDGISTTNRIVLEPEVLAELERFVAQLRAAPVSPSPAPGWEEDANQTIRAAMQRAEDEAADRIVADLAAPSPARTPCCPVPNCHAGMLRDHDGRDSVSCPVCDRTITAADYVARTAPSPSPTPASEEDRHG